MDEETRDFLEEACPEMMSQTHGEAGSLLPYFRDINMRMVFLHIVEKKSAKADMYMLNQVCMVMSLFLILHQCILIVPLLNVYLVSDTRRHIAIC